MHDNTNNPFLTANYAPVHDELDVHELEVDGEIPHDLFGVYMRNGPNPAYPPISYTYPFDGDGMIHALYLQEGKAHYRNRFVETRGLKVERRAGKAVYGGILHPIFPEPELLGSDGEPGPFKTGAFIHVIRHADKIIALHEAAPAYEMTADLSTKGEWALNQHVLPVNAHTRLDPHTGDLYLITYDIEPPYLSYYRLNPQGELIEQQAIEKDYATMMHDFLLTENYIIYVDSPAVLDAQAMMTGGEVLQWRPELGTRIGLQSRQTGKLTWLQTDPFFAFHFANAYEKDNQIIMDYVHHGGLKFLDREPDKFSPPMLYRSIIDIESGSIKHQQLDDNIVEFPRIKENCNRSSHRYIYAPGSLKDDKSNDGFSTLFKYDVEQQGEQHYDFGQHTQIGEAVFAPCKQASSEDDGYVMLFVYDKQTNNSDFIILDARDISAAPLATIKMPRRVPHGLHGSWMPSDA